MTLNPIKIIRERLNDIIITGLFGGIIFVLLGVGIIFFPRIIQYIFVIGFVLIGLLLISMAFRISHLNKSLEKFDFSTKKKVKR